MAIPFFGFDFDDDEPDAKKLADLEKGMDTTSSDWEDSDDDIHVPSSFDDF